MLSRDNPHYLDKSLGDGTHTSVCGVKSDGRNPNSPFRNCITVDIEIAVMINTPPKGANGTHDGAEAQNGQNHGCLCNWTCANGAEHTGPNIDGHLAIGLVCQHHNPWFSLGLCLWYHVCNVILLHPPRYCRSESIASGVSSCLTVDLLRVCLFCHIFVPLPWVSGLFT